MPVKISQMRVVGPFRLSVSITDGSQGEHDFSAMVAKGRGLILELQSRAFFERVFLDYGALSWPKGFDIAPEWLRREMLAAGELRIDTAAAG